MKKGYWFTIFVLIMCVVAIISGAIVCEAGDEAVGVTMMLAGMVVFLTVFVADNENII